MNDDMIKALIVIIGIIAIVGSNIILSNIEKENHNFCMDAGSIYNYTPSEINSKKILGKRYCCLEKGAGSFCISKDAAKDEEWLKQLKINS